MGVSLEIGADSSCKLSPKETAYTKCQSLFSVNDKIITSKCHLLIFLSACEVLYNSSS